MKVLIITKNVNMVGYKVDSTLDKTISRNKKMNLLESDENFIQWIIFPTTILFEILLSEGTQY